MSDVGEYEDGMKYIDRNDDIDGNDWNKLW